MIQRDLGRCARRPPPNHCRLESSDCVGALDQFGTGGFSLLIEDLEEKLLAEIVASLESTTSDDKAVAQASAILKAVEKVRASTKPEVELPNVPAP
jgi:hypothetical protein